MKLLNVALILACLALSAHTTAAQSARKPARGKPGEPADEPANLPQQTDNKDGGSGKDQEGILEATTLILGSEPRTATWTPTAPAIRGYQAWEIITPGANQCVWVCFTKITLRDRAPWGDYIDIYRKNRESTDQSVVEGVLLSGGSIESESSGNQLYVGNVEACCEPDATPSTLLELPEYVACSDVAGGGMSIEADASSIQDPPATFLPVVELVYADTREKLFDQGCPGYVTEVPNVTPNLE
mmetsp:Transcript_20794/g.51120  ORF Transcript_20794/g.51120 Transcript_20794/m.51120 type:complete len:242 (+) Transcript_20794:111-836(+)|eukprot:CAMPEP_0206258072 /NCGR_PEP_ID=MMETSP0047_2-20121206/25711_1 /ASSEMBLY_ACC=CAM_ASM_000192 /TAXON_ID=195065 /ORGANISM="Chroomonas mesostigmatica_cf, Strain CCMP1168" /LENGTH=241 /DNA_ID=CAMNT_0053684765 /DNA_START=106 /DNA_END=831 /DNA_ORIENTATION=-